MVEKEFGIEILPTWHGEKPAHAARFIPQVREDLTRVLQSQAGRALAASLRWHNKKMYLMPYEGQDCNAQEDGVTPGSETPVVLFDPALLRSTPCAKRTDGNNATLPHEMLFHELVHAFRRISKHNHPRAVTGRLLHYRNTEEFLAITLTNIFISDVTNKKKTGLRGAHGDHLAMDPEFTGSFQFFRHGTPAFNIIAGFCDANRGFAGQLSQVRGPFNPIAAYFKNRQKAFNMAADGDSEAVFENLTSLDYMKRDDGVWVRIVDFPRPK
jgi:hypothetical protein